MSVFKRIIDELNEFGISKSTVQEILSQKGMKNSGTSFTKKLIYNL